MTFVDPLTMAGKGYSRTKNMISEKKNKTQTGDRAGQISGGGWGTQPAASLTSPVRL